MGHLLVNDSIRINKIQTFSNILDQIEFHYYTLVQYNIRRNLISFDSYENQVSSFLTVLERDKNVSNTKTFSAENKRIFKEKHAHTNKTK